MLNAHFAPVIVDTFPAYDVGSVSALVLSLVLMGLFWLPGFLWASWLHRHEGFHWTFRSLLGLAWSLALFAACTWPFLWYKLTMTGVLQYVLPVWGLFLLVGLWCGWRLWREGNATSPTPPSPVGETPLPPDETQPMDASARAFLFRLFLYIAVCLLTAYLGAKAVEHNRWNDDERTRFAIILGVLFGIGCLLWVWGGRVLRPWLRFTAADALPPAPCLHGLALGFVLLQAASAVVFDRPDWDDCYYCALMLDYAQVDELNRQEPTHREGFRLDGHNRVLVWELWGGVLCKLSGLNPQALCHTLWAGLLALLAYAGYWQVVKECVPRRWVPLTMLGVGAFFFWGISSHHVMSNYLLVRLWQGKAALIHLGFPLLIVAQLRFMRQPSGPRWLLLLVAVVFALAASSSAIFLAPMLCSALCWAWLWAELRPVLGAVGRWLLPWLPVPRADAQEEVAPVRAFLAQAPWRTWGLAIVGSILALVPAVAYGLLIRSEVLATKAIQFDRNVWDPTYGLAIMAGHVESGSWEMVWFLLLPILGLLLPRPWSIYPVLFTLILVLTWANPALCDPIAQTLTNYWTYFRIFWMLPVWIGIALTLTLLGRIYAKAVTLDAKALEWLTVERVALGLIVSWFLPATYVWGAANLGFVSGGQPHHLGRNLMKKPLGLTELAEHLLQDPDVQASKVRLLCLDSVSNFLTPYDRRFRFVITRELYTLSMAHQADRTEEGIKRHWLSLIFSGRVPQEPGAEPLPYELILPQWYHLVSPEAINAYNPMPVERYQQLLDELAVKYVVLDYRSSRGLAWWLERAGFLRAGTFGPRDPATGDFSPLAYELWSRPVGKAR